MSLLFMNMNGLLIKSTQQLRPNIVPYKYAQLQAFKFENEYGCNKKTYVFGFLNWLLMHINKKPQFDLHCKIYLFVCFIMISCE